MRLVTKPFAQLYNQLAIVRIKKLIRDEKVDIVHQNTSYIYAPAKAAIKSDVPLVWHLREFLEEDQHKRILYTSGDYSDLAAKIRLALKYPDRMRDIAKQGQSKMLNEMTAQNNAFRINELYREIVSDTEGI